MKMSILAAMLVLPMGALAQDGVFHPNPDMLLANLNRIATKSKVDPVVCQNWNELPGPWPGKGGHSMYRQLFRQMDPYQVTPQILAQLGQVFTSIDITCNNEAWLEFQKSGQVD
jgi:hypothetical protein